LHFIGGMSTPSISWASFAFGTQIQLGYAKHNTPQAPFKGELKPIGRCPIFK